MDYAEDGDLRKYDTKTMASSVGLPNGEADKWMEGMLLGPFIDRLPHLRVHNWWDYFGRFLQVKYKSNPEKWRAIKASCDLTCDDMGINNGSNNPPNNGSKAQNQPTDQPIPTNNNQPTDLSCPPGGERPKTKKPPVEDRTKDPFYQVYWAYPRHAKPEAALKAIKAAAKKVHANGTEHPGEYLLEKAKAYAAVRARVIVADPTQDQYTPHPASWFNAGCYDEDPAEWAKTYHDKPQASAREVAQERRMEAIDKMFDEPEEVTH